MREPFMLTSPPATTDTLPWPVEKNAASAQCRHGKIRRANIDRAAGIDRNVAAVERGDGTGIHIQIAGEIDVNVGTLVEHAGQRVGAAHFVKTDTFGLDAGA